MKNIQIKTILFALAVFVLSNTLTGQGFQHTAAGANISGHITYLDHALTNNLPDKLLFISQEWGSAGPYNPHTVGVWYSKNKWTIFNQDFAVMPQQAKFNVLTLDPGERVFIHTASSATISRHVTTIDHPLLNNNPNARILVTQNWGNAGPYNKNAVGVYYTGSRWAIYNQNRAAMPANAKFNVWVDDRIFVVDAATPTTNWFVFDNPATNNQPNALVFATQYWTNVYNTHEIGTWYTNNKWSIFNQDRATMPASAKFFVYVPGAVTTVPPNEVVAVFRTGGDDLRGGNDNVHLVLLMRSGATIRFENVNNGKRWADGSIQPISRPLAANFNAADIVGVRLETTLGGGIGGDNWNLEALKIEIRVNGTNNIVFDKAATPLFRFTGDQRTREFRF